ncbi:MAG: two-component regulator propeller domain-containing protein [Saprospiraceae bacterium]
MYFTKTYIILLLISFCFSCKDSWRQSGELKGLKNFDLNKKYIVSDAGDTIPTNLSIPFSGRVVDLDSFEKPQWVPLRNEPKTIPVKKNIHPIIDPPSFVVPKNIKEISIDQNSKLKQILAQGTKVQMLQPKSIIAERPKMKDHAKRSIVYFDKDSGLPSYRIFNILQDRRGDLWIGTLEGVSRFDGHSFTNFTTKQGLSDNNVYTLFEDSKGILWFGTTNGGLTRYDGQEFTHFTTRGGLSDNYVTSITEDSNGNLWIGTIFGGLTRYDGINFSQYSEHEGLSHFAVHAILEDSRGDLWIGTLQGGLNRFDGESFTHYTIDNGLSNNTVTSLLEDRIGNLWIGTFGGGLNRLSGDSLIHFTTKEGLSSNNISSIEEDSNGNLWIGTVGGGVNRFDGKDFTHISIDQGLSHANVLALEFDQAGNLWVGTESGGLNKFLSIEFTHLELEEGSSGSDISFILEDNDANIWWGSSRNGVYRYNEKELAIFSTNQGFATSSFLCMIEGNNNDLWFGMSDGGLAQFNGENLKIINTDHGLNSNGPTALLQDRNGDLWYGTFDNGVARYDGENMIYYTTAEGLTNRYVQLLYEDNQGNIWISMTRALCRFDGKNLIYFSTAEGLGDNQVYAMIEDKYGILWFGTGGGLTRAIPSEEMDRYYEFKNYRISESLADNAIGAIELDQDENVWMATSSGITQAIRDPNISNRQSTENLKFVRFTQEDGLKRTDFYTVLRDSRNRMWWGSDGGLTMMDMKSYKNSSRPPAISLRNIEINQTEIDFRYSTVISGIDSIPFEIDLSLDYDSVSLFYNYPINLSLPYQLNHLTFHFTAIEWAGPHKIRYQYIMEGLDKDWSGLQTEPFADYRNLPPGKFTFKIKAIGVAQTWSDIFSYTFRIRPPWWFSWWAYLLYSLLAIFLAYQIFQFLLNRQLALAENQQLKELNTVKTKLYTNITHEFRTPLTIIQGVNDQIRKKAERSNDKETFDNTAIVKRNSIQLLNLVNQMLELRKLEAGALSVNLIQDDILRYLSYIVESFHSYAQSKEIRIHFLTEQDKILMDYDPDKILAIVSNLMSNAVKFTGEGGDIYVSVDQKTWENFEQESLVIKIRDTGIGIPAEKLPHIFDRFYQVDDEATRKAEGTGIGLTLTKELVRLVNGEIKVESTVGESTTFFVVLPINRSTKLAEDGDRLIIKEKANAFIPSIAKDTDVIIFKEEDIELPLVLLVEDNKDVQAFLQTCLRDRYEFIVAFNGQQGIDLALDRVPDLIISDVMMPEKDGFELTETLKSNFLTSHIPIILLTAKADIQSRIEGIKHGADVYLNKPFNKEELLAWSQKLIELRKILQERYSGLKTLIPVENKVIQREDEFIQKFTRIVEEHMADPGFDITFLEKKLRLSRTQIHRKLKALTDCATSENINLIRLRNAKQLLNSTELNISEIAYEVGFSDPAYFTKLFTKAYGYPPSEERRRKK